MPKKREIQLDEVRRRMSEKAGRPVSAQQAFDVITKRLPSGAAEKREITTHAWFVKAAEFEKWLAGYPHKAGRPRKPAAED
jgi:hypothetical protein